jgi:hypothetical protein
MNNALKNKFVSLIVFFIVAFSCIGIVQYLRTKTHPNPDKDNVATVAQEPPEFDPDEQDTEDMFYVGTFPLKPISEYVPSPPYAPPNLNDTPLCVFDNYARGAGTVRGESFGTQDKIGIERKVWVLTGNRVADFEFMRDHSAARDAFALQHTGIARSIARHWDVCVFEMKGNQIRLLASRGCDDNVDGIGFEDAISERWQLNAIGANPTLLERTYDNITLP